jgi:hypothetical protein
VNFRDKPSEPRVWTNGDGLWIRSAIRGLTFAAGPAVAIAKANPLEEARGAALKELERSERMPRAPPKLKKNRHDRCRQHPFFR